MKTTTMAAFIMPRAPEVQVRRYRDAPPRPGQVTQLLFE
jgi:hypothetical protein